MKKFLFLMLTTLSLWGCGDDETNSFHPIEKTYISGTIEKGPFTAGSQVTLYELNTDFSQTGKIFRTTTIDDLGNFIFDTPINLTSQYAELEIDGYFYNETLYQLSNSQVTLRALVDLSSRNKINVNILTHLEYARVKALLKKSLSFNQAKEQADKELLRIFAITDAISTPENISMADDNEEAQILLAISSIMLQNRSEAEFTELVAKFSSEFSADGTISSPSLLSEIHDSQRNLSPTNIVEHMKTYYQEKGTELNIRNFSRFVDFNGDGVIDENDKEDIGPSTAPDEDNLFDTEEGFKAALDGLYVSNVTFLTHQLYLEAIRTGLLQSSIDDLFMPNSSELETLWSQAWNIIANANVILQNAKEQEYSFPAINSYIAQTELIRAFIYYNLAHLWGSLPLRDENNAFDPTITPYQSKESILNHLIERIQQAEQTLQNVNTQYGYVSNWMAYCLETEVQLELKNYTRAIECSRKIIDSNIFSYSPNSNYYEEQTPEVIFALSVSAGANSHFSTSIQKGNFLPIYRYTSVLLMYAEAMNRQGYANEALEALHHLGYEGNYTSTNEINKVIASLWRSHIGMDYGYWALLKRLNLAVTELGIEPYMQLFPYPNNEIDLGGVIQNPGYNN